jgi:hypothetical protein
MPIIDIDAIERRAGCFAKISTPNPAIVVAADKNIDARIDGRNFLSILIFTSQAVHNKDAVIVSKPEDECRYHHVHDVEFDIEQGHKAEGSKSM